MDGGDAQLFELWRGSLAVCGGILDKLARGRLDPEARAEAYGAMTSLLRGAHSAAAELEARMRTKVAALATALAIVGELRAVVRRQRAALAAEPRVPLASLTTDLTEARETEAERALRSRVAALEEALAAEREATRIARVVCETLQRKAGRAEVDAADARAAADAFRVRNRSLERIVNHLEKTNQELKTEDRNQETRGENMGPKKQ
eukprot:CAMPEP_0119267296 /NCGR_PEP_ID=MMETSP1329-20130426/5496_1 /TAXON_ID=114041 /ORGANISM="Genus nov. species nov., Strain RCC1024" /LENGTH=205 /DNA_ID=CAMNT_0007267213 /DNA_START=110 /DNA_END=725 /DNA_ORIENTATION=+